MKRCKILGRQGGRSEYVKSVEDSTLHYFHIPNRMDQALLERVFGYQDRKIFIKIIMYVVGQ